MSDRVRIYFTGDCEGFDALRGALATTDEVDVVGASVAVDAAATPLAGGHLDCVLHATRDSFFPANDVAAIRELTRAPIILVASGAEAAVMLESAIEMDVADVLLLPQLTHNVVFAIRKASHARRQLQTAAHRGRVVTVFSPKGGTGIMLGLEPAKTVYDLVVAPGELDPEKLAGYVTRHPCGLDVLAAPLRPEDAELVVESKVTALLDVARASYDAIVVDTSPFFHGAVLATLDRTDQLLVLCGLDVPTLKNVRLALQTLEQLSFPANRITYVMNRASANVGLKTREVEDGLHVKIAHELPLDRTVQVCVNRGESAVLAQPRSEFARAMDGLVKQMSPKAPTPTATQRKRLMSFARA